MRIQKWWAADAVTLLLVAPTFASPTSTSGEDVSRISEAANAWTKHGTCSGKLFERTPANIRSSNYLELYNEAISKLKVEFPEEYRNSGEASLFAQKIANAHGFTCTSQTPGCDEIPSCQSVALYVQQQNYTAEETVDRTSKIMLAIHQINAISKYLNTLKRIVKHVEQTMSEISFTIVEQYTSQPDFSAEQKCFLLHQFHDFGLKFLANLNSFAWNVLTSNKGPKNMQGIPNPAPLINSLFIDLPVMLDAVYSKWDQLDELEVWKSLEKPNRGELRMDQTYLSGMCNRFGGDMPNENLHRVTQMQNYIAMAFTNLHTGLDRVQKMLMNGNPLSNHSQLAQWMDRPEIADAVTRLVKHEDEYRRNITRGALELLISDSLASSKCYGKCRRITFFGRWFCTMDKENRYCPDANTGCEAKCLTTRKGGNKEVDLIGKKFLAGYGLTVAQILEKSYQNYQRHGNMFRGPVDIKKTGMGLDAIATGETSMIALPICISEFVEVTGAPGADKSRYPHFPCSCGDWTGNETQSFYSRLGLARGDRDVTTGEASELFERICPFNMRPMPPFTNFINQCQNNMQWPQVGKSGKKPEDLAYTYRYKLGRGASEHCGKMLNETEGMSQGEANYHFCKDSTTGKEIMSGERPHIDTEVLIHLYEFNHRKQCDGFLAKYNPWH